MSEKMGFVFFFVPKLIFQRILIDYDMSKREKICLHFFFSLQGSEIKDSGQYGRQYEFYNISSNTSHKWIK